MYDARLRSELGTGLATAFLSGIWSEAAMADRGRRALEPRPRWVPEIARRVLALYVQPPRDRPRELARVIAVLLAGLPPATGPAPRLRRLRPVPERMVRPRFGVLVIHTPADLAESVELDAGQLRWLADSRSLERRAAAAKLRNYTYGFVPRRSGLPRAIERPKARLKEIQRMILREILDLVPAHPAAHGFTRGRSARTNAAAHVGREVVASFDLHDFFLSVTAARVYGLFRTLGYPESVAHVLTALTTNVVPEEAWAALAHPTDPRLLSPLGATYTRYADDLTFSGNGALRTRVLRHAVASIAADEGFRVHAAESRLATRAGRQEVTGIVVNARPNLPRPEYDRLKAAVHQGGPEDHDRLLGRVSWLASLNPARGGRLRRRLGG